MVSICGLGPGDIKVMGFGGEIYGSSSLAEQLNWVLLGGIHSTSSVSWHDSRRLSTLSTGYRNKLPKPKVTWGEISWWYVESLTLHILGDLKTMELSNCIYSYSYTTHTKLAVIRTYAYNLFILKQLCFLLTLFWRALECKKRREIWNGEIQSFRCSSYVSFKKKN